MLEIAPDAIRNARLKRRLRGYDRGETEDLLTAVAESYDKLFTERQHLSEQVARLQRERQEDEVRSRAELDRLNTEMSERDRHITDLESQLAHFEEESSKQLEELERLRQEFESVRTVQNELEAELQHQHDRLARLAIREKALVEQRAMLASQLAQEEDGQTSPHLRALPERGDRVDAMLLRLDRFVETLEREARREAELTLKKARQRADDIVRAAQVQRRRVEGETVVLPAADQGGEEYDPVAALARIEPATTQAEMPEPAERDLGEALWTTRGAVDETPEPSR
jgi:cell division septum initiation protein DivIVA